MKTRIHLALLLLAPLAHAQTAPQALNGFCTQGGVSAAVSGINATNKQQGIVPSCKVSVFLTGTNTPATIFSDAASTPLSNPFTANAVGMVGAGKWLFYAAPGVGYDVQMSGGIPPNVFASPLTLTDVFTGGSGGSGGGGAPGGVFQSIQFNQNPTTFGGSNAKVNPNGDVITLSTNGNKSASLNQSSPGSCNGIVNQLQTPGTIATADQNYNTCQEFQTTATPVYWHTPFGTSGFGGLPPAIADNTTLFDNRTNSLGSWMYNPIPNQPNNYQQVLLNEGSDVEGSTWAFNQTDVIIHGGGENEELGFNGGNQTVHGFQLWNFYTQAQGISSVLSINATKIANGDFQMYNNDLQPAGGAVTPSDEGYEIWRNQSLQPNFPFAGTASTTLAKGTTIITPITQLTSTPTGEGLFFVVPTQAGPVLHCDTETGPSGITPGNCGTREAMTPDTFGNFNGPINTPQQPFGRTTAMTVNLTGLTAPITTSATVCFNDHVQNESASLVSVTNPSGSSPNITQTIVVNLKYAYNLGAPFNFGIVTQGPQACKGIEVLANQSFGYNPSLVPGGVCPTTPLGPAPCPIRYIARAIGATDAHTLVYAIPLASGGWSGMRSQAFFPGIFAGVTFTRSGGVVTVPVASGYPIALQNSHIQVSGCSDSSFNTASVAVATVGGSSFTYAQAGSNGTATCNPIAVIAQNGLASNSIQLMPAAKVVQSENPTLLDQSAFVIEANDITINPMSTTDQIEVQPGNQIVLNEWHTLTGLINPSSSSDPYTLINASLIDAIPDGTTLLQYNILADPTQLVGGGGTRNPRAQLIALRNDPGIFQNLTVSNGMTSNGIAFEFTGCGVYSCLDPLYGYQIMNVASDPSLGGFSMGWSPSTDLMQFKTGTGNRAEFDFAQSSISLGVFLPGGSFVFTGMDAAGLHDSQAGTIGGHTILGTRDFDFTTLVNQITDTTASLQCTEAMDLAAGWTFSCGTTPHPTRVDQLVVNSSQALTSVFGNGVVLPSATGSFANGNLRSTNSTGAEVDSGLATTAIPAISGTPTVGQAACIKAAGPPVVIGFCSTTPTSGTCTCN